MEMNHGNVLSPLFLQLFFFLVFCCNLAINVVVDHLNPGVNSNYFYSKISVKESRWFLYQ